MPAEADELVGQLIEKRYLVKGVLGLGGMGTVYEVEQVQLGRRLALKTLHAEFCRNKEVVSRFHREARAAAAIGDEHIVEIHDVGELPEGEPYIVLELLERTDLGDLLEQVGEGTLRINSRPWSQIFVDGRKVGNTPLLNLTLAAGSTK